MLFGTIVVVLLFILSKSAHTKVVTCPFQPPGKQIFNKLLLVELFVKQFGYLASGAPNTEALHTEEAITEAVRQIQIFCSLEPSGVLIQETLEVSKL